MHIISLISHSKKNNVFFDYYEDTKQGVVNYVLKADGKVIYKGWVPISDWEIKVKVQEHLNVLTSSKYNEPKKENSPSVVLPMTL